MRILILALLLIPLSAQAAPIVYNVVRADATGTITTDGFLGWWGYGLFYEGTHILDFDLTLQNAHLTSENAHVLYYLGVSSTDTELRFHPFEHTFLGFIANDYTSSLGWTTDWQNLAFSYVFANGGVPVQVSEDPPQMPEPATALLLGMGLAMLAWHRKERSWKTS